MADREEFKGLPHVRVEDFSDRDYLRIQEDVQRAEAHDRNVETGALVEDHRGSDVVDQEKLQKAVDRVLDKADDDVEGDDHDELNLGVEQAVEASAAERDVDRVEDGPAKDTPKADDGGNVAETNEDQGQRQEEAKTRQTRQTARRRRVSKDEDDD